MAPIIRSLLAPPLRALTLLALAVLVGGLYVAFHALRSPAPATAWYIDEHDGTTPLNPADAFTRPATAIPPLPNPQGQPTIVRAMFVTDPATGARTLAYLEKFTPQAQAAFARVQSGAQPPSPEFLFATQAGHLIRLPAPGAPWVAINSPAAGVIFSRLAAAHATYAPPQP